jgi:molybdate transport system ATP-binding protein
VLLPWQQSTLAEDLLEAAVLELVLSAQRGSFDLDVGCSFGSEWTVIFGPSGAGKSTLLRLIAGLELSGQDRRRTARVVLDGRALTDSTRRVWLKPRDPRSSLTSA